ncbi:leucine-rich PPR motif-containing protein, mitochondrial isoform X2 [Ochlerotatus camptorhynchus]|uniref:leucine-rich PPR motif-containing protein, mitochondrial isoform X2 n=1 Tax=Ochlerotatus camptorhynchus TaxID=644619 RepID=UPI0031DB852E
MNIVRSLLQVQHRLVLCRSAVIRMRSTFPPSLRPMPSQLFTRNDSSPSKWGSCSFASQAKPRFKKAKTTINPLDELKADVLAYRRVHLDRLNQILAKPEDIPAESYDFLLSCCGKLLLDHPVEARMKLFRNLWFMANRGDETVPLDRWKTWLRVYRENAVDFDGGVEQFLAGVKVEKDQEFYELLLGVVCERGDVPKMWEVMEMFKVQGLGSNVGIAAALVRGHSKAGDLEAMRTVLDTMSAGNIEPDEGVYGELVVGWMRNNQMEKALQLISEKGSLLKENHVAEALKEALVRDHKEAIKLLVRLFPVDVIQDSSIDPVIRNICSDLFREGKFESVRALLNELPVPKFNLNENYDSYAVSLIFEMVKANAPLEELVLLVDLLIKTERNTRALHVACECAAKHCIDIYPELLGMLKEQEDLRPHYFWPLIVHNFTKHGEAGVLDVLKLMKRYRTEIDVETISVFVLPKLAISLKDVRTLLKQFEDRGVKMSVLMTPLVSHLLYQNRFDDAIKVAKLYSSKVDTEALIYPLVLQMTVNKTAQHFNTMSEVVRQLKDKAQNPKHDLAGQLLMELISNKKTKHDASTIKSLLEQFSTFEIRISRMSANVLKNHFSMAKQINAALDKLINSLVEDKLTIPSREMFDSMIVHPRDMSYEELECHLGELEEKKLNSRGVLRRLLQVCVRENRLDRALEIKQKCDESKVELSSGMLASVFDLHIKRKNVDEAGKTLEQIKTMFPGFLLDEHKVIDFAALLAEKGFPSNAQKVIKQRASSGQLRPGNSNKNIWNLLTNTAQWAAENDYKSDKNHTSEMLKFLVDLGYCTFDNALLGPVIREYLLKNQTRNAVTEYRRIATEKRRTPLQLEIFTTLVRLTNATDPEISPEEAKALLGEVIQIGSKIHGSVNTNNTLIVALAEAGTEAQLRRILINPETRVNHEYILTQCEFLVNSGKLDVVLRLAKCSRGLANVREADFLAVIMKQYVRDNNCEAAVELFNRLQAEDGDFKISGDFARKLIDLLEVNNYEVPNAVRLYAK